MINKKGITLTTLVIIIGVMIILAGVASYAGVNSITYTRKIQFRSELIIISEKVTQLVEEVQPEELNQYGKSIESQDETTKTQIETALGQTDMSGFRYFEKEDLEKIGVSGIDRQVIINFTTNEVIDINGIKQNGDKVYKLQDLNFAE